ncbi:MAG TPA: peptidylprolyl isomerase [Streptosporangiaceae bacterium]|nr:peptidylprolyl isomerase [Streptosporangiaceae bacterium]
MAGKSERQRRLARQRYERRVARRAQRDRRTRRWTISVLAGLAVVAVTLGSVFLAGGFSSGSSSAATSGATPAVSTTHDVSASPPPTTASEPAHHCTYTASPPAARKVSFPSARPDYTAAYQATIRTNRGSIVISLLNSRATCTVNSFVHLAEQDYFSNTRCHRLTTSGIFVLQCGDPTGTGAGGPGYKFGDENLAGATYPAGTVAMANNGPNSSGSQFFLVYKNSLTLPASYTPFGTIASGLNIIQQVARAGSANSNHPGDGHPKEKVVIESVTISKT